MGGVDDAPPWRMFGVKILCIDSIVQRPLPTYVLYRFIIDFRNRIKRHKMAGENVLIFGGNGRIARSMTSLMLARSWKVTSVIRNVKQKDSILQLGENQPGKINVLSMDMQNIRNPADVSRILETVKPTCVVFAAGMAPHNFPNNESLTSINCVEPGSFQNVYAIDRDAAQRIIKASTDAPFIAKFLMLSFPSSRRSAAPWWGKSDIQNWQQEINSYPDIAEAKIQADEYLVAMSKARESSSGSPFQAISLRPSWLRTGPPMGRVKLGKTPALGQVNIADVAAVGVSLLARNDTSGWYDLVQGSDTVENAVDMCVKNEINCIEGEDLDRNFAFGD